MRTVFDRLVEQLEEAKKAATLQNASFGFPKDQIEVKSVHFGDDDRGREGDLLHPTEYVRKITRIHHETWIVGPLDAAIATLRLHAETLRQSESLLAALERLAPLVERAKAGRDG